MSESILAVTTAAWLGFLCSISPCPLATNIAAISFVSRKVGKVGVVLSAGVLYTLGRTITYAILGILLVGGLSAAPELSHLLQKYMNLLMGPFLLLPQFNTCSSSGVFDRLLMKKSFDLLRLFLNASHMGFCMFFKLSIPFCRRSFGKGRFQIPVQ